MEVLEWTKLAVFVVHQWRMEDVPIVVLLLKIQHSNPIFKNQFIDVIEYIDPSDKLIVSKYSRPDNEIKEGAKLIVRESQCAIFVCQGQIADIFGPGTYKLKTANLPILSTLEAFSFGFRSPIRSDLYFVSLKQFMNNKWATKRPLIKRDKEFSMVRLRAFGKFSFAIADLPDLVLLLPSAIPSLPPFQDLTLLRKEQIQSMKSENTSRCLMTESSPKKNSIKRNRNY